MKDIRIFVASSKEFKRERNYLVFLMLFDAVLVCHLFETPPPELNALWYTYAHAGIMWRSQT